MIFKRKILELKTFPTDSSQFIELVVNLYQKQIDLNERKKNDDDLFATVKIPRITLADYLKRIIKYGVNEPSDANTLLTIVTIYINRLNTKFYTINNQNIHRILLTSLLLAQKMFCDDHYTNQHFAKVGGISLAELNKLERKFLSIMDNELFVFPEEFYDYQQFILNQTAFNKYDFCYPSKRQKLK